MGVNPPAYSCGRNETSFSLSCSVGDGVVINELNSVIKRSSVVRLGLFESGSGIHINL